MTIQILHDIDPADDRNKIVGASEVACLFDQHQFITRGDKFHAVCTNEPRKAPSHSMKAGHLAENIIMSELYAGRVKGLEGCSFETYVRTRWLDDEIQLAATPDGHGFVDVDGVRKTFILERKFSNQVFNLHPDYGKLYWWWQVQAQMACAPSETLGARAVIVLLDGNLTFKHWWVERDPVAVKSIRHEVKKFWAEVAAGKCEYLGRLPTYFECRDDIQQVKDPEVDELVKTFQVRQVEQNIAKQNYVSARDALLDRLGTRGEYHTPEFKIKVAGAKGKTPTPHISEWT